jgi:putative FmdB family regulatory protein
MPIYEYQCEQCGSISEFLENITTEKPDVICRQCGSDQLSRVLSTGFIPKSGTFNEPRGGNTCCGREERCSAPPCSTGQGCMK